MKHVVITGSTRGIGFGIAKEFIKKGHKVTINGTSNETVKRALNELSTLFPSSQFHGVYGDVSRRADVEKLWNDAFNQFGSVDIWINNAGVDQERKFVWEMSQADYERVIKTNIIGVMNGSTIAFRHMLNQGHGYIYNMEGFGSNGMIREKMTIYGTSKTAVSYFTRSLSLEAKPTNIKIGTLSPGMVATDFLKKSIVEGEEEGEKTKKVFNILADKVETVTPYLVKKILENDQNGAEIKWLTKPKIMWRFISSSFNKRNLFD